MGDIVFLPTLSDFDYHTLAEYLRSDPQTELPDWHLQFHFAFLEGRPAEYTRQQDRVESMRRRFESALQAAPNHRLHFYSTTQEMVDQFRRASPANFELLPYPVNPSYRGHDPDQRLAGPLRITCAGAVREEKGQQQVVTVLRTLWEQYFARQKLQLLVQSKKSRFRAALYREGLPATSIGRWPLPCGSPIVDVPHPLTTDAYAKLLAASDLALFLYDSRRYYARCAGILVEMLAAGVPVVVPAGCWLGEQIAEAVYSHLDGLRAELDELGRIDIAGRLSGSMSASRRTWNPNDGHFDSQSPIAHVEIPAGARHLMVRLRWAGRVEQGTVARLDVRQYSATGQVLDSAATSLGQRTSGHSVPGCVHVAPGAARVEMLLCNAFGEQPLPLERATAVFLSGRRTGEATCPLGAVGLIAADTTQVPRLVRDIVNHHNHYVRTAREFSRSWADTHEPEEIVRQLRRRSQAEPRCDAAAVPGHGFHRVRSVNSVLR